MPQPPRRLLYIVNNPAFLLSHRRELAQAAQRDGFAVHVAAPPGDGIPELRALGFAFHPIPLARAGLNPLEDLTTLAALLRLLLELRPHLLHLVTIKPVVYGGIAARLTGVPGVVSAISGLGNLFVEDTAKPGDALVRRAVAALYRLALNHPRGATIVQNPDDLRFVTQQGWVQPERLVLIKGSGVDTRRFTPQPQEPPGPPLVVLPARLVVDKGVPEFVEAARLLKQRGLDARFALIGPADPDARHAIPEDTLHAWTREGVVEWWGFQRDMIPVYAQAHAVCLPSWNEGLPKSLIEAAACGLPIVATDVPGCREIARHERNALLVPPRSPQDLADALHRVLTQPDLRARLGAEGRAMVLAEFSLDYVIAATLALYRQTLPAAP